jgi:hypothetical protein
MMSEGCSQDPGVHGLKSLVGRVFYPLAATNPKNHRERETKKKFIIFS